MPGGMTFRKDCEECGRSFLTPDKKAKVCQRCIGKAKSRPQPEKETGKRTSLKGAGKTQGSAEKKPSFSPVGGATPPVSPEIAAEGKDRMGTEPLVPSASRGKEKAGKKEASPAPERNQEATPLTPAQIQEIVDRYQKYVEILERPTIGRRKTIAAVMGLTYPRVVLGLRQWNQQQAQTEELSREQRFAIEKIYFACLEEDTGFLEIKARIIQETGIIPWLVSRYLDLLHDGERKLQDVPSVAAEQENAILAEYRNYLAASGPPEPPLHALIGERTGVTPKQVYKVLLAYRLGRFRKKWGNSQ